MSRPKGKCPSVRLSVSLDHASHTELTRLAQQYDLSVAWMVRKAITEFIERHVKGHEPVLPLQQCYEHDKERIA